MKQPIRWFAACLILFLSAFFSAQGMGEYGALKAEQHALQQALLARDRLPSVYAERLAAVNRSVTQSEITQALVVRENVHAALNSVQIAVANVAESIHLISLRIEKMKEEEQKAEIQLDKPKMFFFRQVLLAQQQVLECENARLSTLKELVTVRQNIADLTRQWCEQLVDLERLQIRHRHINTLLAHLHHLQDEQNQWLKRVDYFKQQPDGIQQSFHIYIEEEKITLNRLATLLIQLQIRAEDFFSKQNAASVIKVSVDRGALRALMKKLTDLDAAVKTRVTYINNHKQLLERAWQQKEMSDAEYKAFISELSGITLQYRTYQVKLHDFITVTQQFEKETRQQYKYDLYQRESLPGFTWGGWKALVQHLIVTPRLLLQYVYSTTGHVLSLLGSFNRWGLAGFFVFSGVLAAACFYLQRYLGQVIDYFGSISRRFSQDVLWVVLRLIKNNLLFFPLILFFSVLEFFLDINLRFFINFFLIVMSASVAIHLTRILLIDGISSMVGMSRIWYSRLRLFFIITAVLSACLFVAHALPVNEAVHGFFNRIFMLVLLVLSILLFRAWTAGPALLQRIFSVRRNYIMNAIRLFCRVLPITLFSNAVIGLAGYVQLAWLIGGIQAIALMVLFGYLVARGLIFDLIELCYEMTIRHVKNGWLWAQVLLKPLDKILRFGLTLSVVWILVMAYGLNENQKFVDFSHKVLVTPLVNLGDNLINFAFLFKAVVFIAVLCWIGKWSREFAFRSLYARARDVGLRNSLSVFTQYAVVVLGVTITLKILGVDLKGLAVVAAAFAAGIGFGLRDLFSNFFSGILLLVERPVRAGDLITIGPYEGQIISTGMRSMKVRTWDHMEVIVPNSDMFTKPFVNWTLQDSIIRSVVTLRLDRVDDPHHVQELIYEVLKSCRSVLEDPGPEVFLKELSESLIEMEVRYYINLQVDSSRSGVRSAVLFAIWDCFHQHNIHPPYPHLDMPVCPPASQA